MFAGLQIFRQKRKNEHINLLNRKGLHSFPVFCSISHPYRFSSYTKEKTQFLRDFGYFSGVSQFVFWGLRRRKIEHVKHWRIPAKCLCYVLSATYIHVSSSLGTVPKLHPEHFHGPSFSNWRLLVFDITSVILWPPVCNPVYACSWLLSLIKISFFTGAGNLKSHTSLC